MAGCVDDNGTYLVNALESHDLVVLVGYSTGGGERGETGVRRSIGGVSKDCWPFLLPQVALALYKEDLRGDKGCVISLERRGLLTNLYK